MHFFGAKWVTELNRREVKNIDFNIIGTDISSRILKRAQAWSYTQLEVQRGLAASLLIRYFAKNESDQWLLNVDIRNHIDYRQFNFKQKFLFPQKFHLIFCRNVLIYQSVANRFPFSC